MHPIRIQPTRHRSIPPKKALNENKKGELATWEYYDPPENSPPVEFCLNTSLHGLKYVGQPERHFFERIFWVVAFTATVSAAGYLIYTMWDGFFDTPIMTVFAAKETSLEEIPFPAVTICNVNNINLSKWKKYINQTNELLEKQGNDSNDPEFLKALAILGDVQNICHTQPLTKRLVSHAGKEWFRTDVWRSLDALATSRRSDYAIYSEPYKILNEASQNCSDMVLFCMWLDVIQNCSALFQEVETDYGYCCTFNTIPLTLLLKYKNDSRDSLERIREWEKINLSADNLLLTSKTMGSKYPFRQAYPGSRGGLTVLLDPDVKEYACTNTDSEGFAIGINGPLDYPRMKDNGILVGTGSEVFINVRPEVTMSDPAIKKYKLDKRNCYFADEKSLPHYSKYTVSNCLNECIAVKTMEKCECVRFDMPRMPNDPVCKPEKYNCTETVRTDTIHQGLSEGCESCYPPCTDVEFSSDVMTLSIREEYMKRIFDAYPTRSHIKAQNISIVHVYLGVDSTYPRLRKEVYGIIDLISNTGGLLGLCMGFSMLSLVEILYHCSLRVCFRYRRKCLQGREDPRNIHKQQFGSTTFKPQQNWFSKIFSRSSTPIILLDFPSEEAIFTYVRYRKSRVSSGKMTLSSNKPSFQTAFSRGYEPTTIAVRKDFSNPM